MGAPSGDVRVKQLISGKNSAMKRKQERYQVTQQAKI
jgi:hypothetical protein